MWLPKLALRRKKIVEGATLSILMNGVKHKQGQNNCTVEKLATSAV
jgi:hypothetical protein